MSTKRQTLAEFSLEWRENDIKGQKLEANKHAAYDDHRRLQAAPADDHTARIEKISNGEAVAPYIDRESQIRAAANRCHDMKEACELHHHKSRAIKQKALGALCKTLLPEQCAILKRKASAMVEAHEANFEYNELKEYLIREGGLVGICLTDSESTRDVETNCWPTWRRRAGLKNGSFQPRAALKNGSIYPDTIVGRNVGREGFRR